MLLYVIRPCCLRNMYHGGSESHGNLRGIVFVPEFQSKIFVTQSLGSSKQYSQNASQFRLLHYYVFLSPHLPHLQLRLSHEAGLRRKNYMEEVEGGIQVAQVPEMGVLCKQEEGVKETLPPLA